MAFNLLIYTTEGPGVPGVHETQRWPERLKDLVPGIQVNVAGSAGEALELVGEADAAYGNITPELFARAERLRWVACPQAGPAAGYYHRALIESDVVVTNVRGIYNDHISAHIMALLLSFSRALPAYYKAQQGREWIPEQGHVYLPEATVAVVGVGGIGAETARLCAEFGMTAIGVDGRVQEAPPGVSELHPPASLHEVLPARRLRGADRAGDARNTGHVRSRGVRAHEVDGLLHQHREGRHGPPRRPERGH